MAPFVIWVMTIIVMFATAVGVFVTGTGGGLVIDHTRLEADIQGQAEIGFPISSVSCPPEVPVIAGDTFTCTARMESGSTRSVLVTITNSSGYTQWHAPIGFAPRHATKVVQHR